MSQRKTNIMWHCLYVKSKKKKNTNELIYKTEIDPTENRKQTYDYQTANLSLPHTPLPFGSHKFVFSICESVSIS